MNFETSLRASSRDSGLRSKEKKWSNIPKKEKKEFPISYPGFKQEKEELKKLKSGEQKDLKY